MALFLYKILTSVLTPFVALLFCLHPRGRLKLSQRLGFWGKLPNEVIWLHAASVGEVNGLLPLIPYLRKRFVNLPILMTATSVSGIERAAATVDLVRVLPFDCPFCIKFALKNTKVKIFLFGETELWPGALSYLKKRNVPIIMLNATITDFSFNAYHWVKKLLPELWNYPDFVGASNKDSYERLSKLGVPNRILTLTGNMKYCKMPIMTDEHQLSELKKKYFIQVRPCIVLGSIRPEEEKFWLESIKKHLQDFNIIVAPRHIDKLDYFIKQFQAHNIPFALESLFTDNNPPISDSILLVDSLGKLEKFYAISDLAFVGASLIPGIGGHNPLEPAAYGTYVCMGKYHQNVKQIVLEMIEYDACQIIEDSVQIGELLSKLKNNVVEINLLGENSHKFYLKQNQALQKVEQLLDGYKL